MMIVTSQTPLEAALTTALTRFTATSSCPQYLRVATPADIEAALSRFVATAGCPKYLRDAATAWLKGKF